MMVHLSRNGKVNYEMTVSNRSGKGLGVRSDKKHQVAIKNIMTMP